MLYKVTKKKIWRGKLNFTTNEKMYDVEVKELNKQDEEEKQDE